GVELTLVDQNAPNLFTALQEQRGLKLESTRAPSEVMVIDSGEQPSLGEIPTLCEGRPSKVHATVDLRTAHGARLRVFSAGRAGASLVRSRVGQSKQVGRQQHERGSAAWRSLQRGERAPDAADYDGVSAPAVPSPGGSGLDAHRS